MTHFLEVSFLTQSPFNFTGHDNFEINFYMSIVKTLGAIISSSFTLDSILMITLDFILFASLNAFFNGKIKIFYSKSIIKGDRNMCN